MTETLLRRRTAAAVLRRIAGHIGRGDDAMALAIVMFPLLILAILASSLIFATRTDLLTARNTHESLHFQLAEEAIVARTLWNFLGSSDGWPEMNGNVATTSFDGMTINTSIRPESAKINLNDPRNEALANLLVLACVPRPSVSALLDKIADYTDADDGVRLHGLEKDGYSALGLPYGPRNARFESIDEVRRVPGITQDLYDWIRPFVTVYSFNKIPDLYLADRVVQQATLGLENRAGLPTPIESLSAKRPSVPSNTFVGVITVTAWAVEDGKNTPALEATAYLTGDKRNPLVILSKAYVSRRPERKVCL